MTTLPQIPALPSTTSLTAEIVARLSAATSDTEIDTVRDTMVRPVWSRMGAADRDAVNRAGLARRTVIAASQAWSAIFGSLSRAVTTTPPSALNLAPAPAPVADGTSLETTLARISVASQNAPRADRARATRSANAISETRAEAARLRSVLLTEGDSAELRWGDAIVNHLTERKVIMSALGPSMQHLAPGVPSGVAHLGEACGKLNNTNGLVARRIKNAPKGVESRWIVVGLDVDVTDIGEVTIEREITADLTTEGQLVITPATGRIAGIVRDAYERRVAGVTYDSTTILAWVKRTLRRTFDAVRCYDTVLVPAAKVADATTFVNAISHYEICGRWDMGLDTRATDNGVRRGLLSGFRSEVAALARAVADAKRTPESLLVEIHRHTETVKAYAHLLGDQGIAPIAAQLQALHVECAGRLDYEGTSQRYAMMDLT